MIHNFLEKYDMVLLDNFLCDIKYTTLENFMGKILYKNVPCCVRRGTYNKLLGVQKELYNIGLQLKIWDAYRPYSVQLKMWDAVHDEKFVSNPYIQTFHPRGNAVDVTLCDLMGNEVEMPTDFDSFNFKANRKSFSDWTLEAQKNFKILEDLMIKYGFLPLETEWWHFNDEDFYEVIYD